MSLPSFILRRVAFLLPMLLGITALTFVLTHLVPADPIAANLGDRAAADPEAVAAFRHRWGLDRSLPEQYLVYIGNLLHGDFGDSISTTQPVGEALKQRLPATVELAVTAIVLSVLVGIPLGIVSAAKRDTLLDQLVRVFSLVGVSTPVFWLGLLAITVFYAWLGWAPPPGRLSADLVAPPFVTGFLVVDALIAGRFEVALDALRHLVLPAVVLASSTVGIITRMMRSSMLDILNEDYVRTARAKGLSPRTVLFAHAARNALIPVITIVGLNFGQLMGGAVVIESVFSWPGLGLFAYRSALSFDYGAIMGVGIVIAITYTLVNLFVDVLYGLVDPRIRRS